MARARELRSALLRGRQEDLLYKEKNLMHDMKHPEEMPISKKEQKRIEAMPVIQQKPIVKEKK